MTANFGTDKITDYWWTNEMYDSARQEQKDAILAAGCTCMHDFYVVNNGTSDARLEQQTVWASPGCLLHGYE